MTKNLLLFLMSLALASCVKERISLKGVDPPSESDKNLTITIPGGFYVAGTRGLTDTQEKAIEDIYILRFTGGNLADIKEVAIATELEPVANTDNQYTIKNYTVPEGLHNFVMLANTAELGKSDGIKIGAYTWAKTNLDTYQTFAANEYDYGRLYQFGSAAMPAAGKVAWPGKSNPAAVSASNPGKRWSDGANVNSFSYPSTLSNSGGWTAANNPCPPGWSVPTRAQWADFLTNSTDDRATDTINGVQGRKFISNANSSIYLFLPLTGFRDSSGTVGSPTSGHYWSSTPWSGSSTSGYDLSYTGNNAADSQGPCYVSVAIAIRCVSDAVPDPNALTLVGIADITVGQTYNEVATALGGEVGGKMYASGGAIPMWGESGELNPADVTDIDIDLHRAITRIDVGEGVYDENTKTWPGIANFEMTSVTVVKPNGRYFAIPAAANLDAGGVPNAPTIPGATAGAPNGDKVFSLADSQSRFTYTTTAGAAIVGQIYVPEAEINSVAHTDQMALVIGGRYSTDTNPTYYRVNFKRANGDLVDVLRNNLYRFSIISVAGRGWADVPTAYQAVESNINVSITGWDTIDFPTNL